MNNYPSIAEIIDVKPVVMITGFLGAGKTTLLRELLVELKAEKIISDVILNDYADASIDSSTLQEFAQSVEPLTATCACCEGMDFLLDLCQRSLKSSADILFIELNGTADPIPIVESFTLLEEKLRLFPRWQVCVIDVRNFRKRGAYSDIEELQIQAASHIYLSHHHSNDGDLAAHISHKIRAINPHASILGKKTLFESVFSLACRKRSITSNISQYQKGNFSSSIHSATHTEIHLKTHEVTACKILIPSYAKEDTIKQWLKGLPSGVIRAKLLIGVSERPKDRYLYERVATEISKHPLKVVLSDNVPNSAILIGPDLNVGQLKDFSTEILGACEEL